MLKRACSGGAAPLRRRLSAYVHGPDALGWSELKWKSTPAPQAAAWCLGQPISLSLLLPLLPLSPLPSSLPLSAPSWSLPGQLLVPLLPLSLPPLSPVSLPPLPLFSHLLLQLL